MAALGLSDDPNLLDAGRIGALFRAVNAGLHGVGLHAPVEVVVVGGAAIAMQWNPGRATYDVDVVSEGIPAVFWGVVADVGRVEDLDAEWLNAAARVKAPTGPTPGEPTAIYLGSHLRVYGASPHYVLAMKLLTGRGVDLEDVPILLDVVQPTSRDELYDLVERAYPTAQIPASARYIIEQSWDAYAAGRPDRGQSGGLSMATSDSGLEQRVVAEPTSTSCRCSQAGWRCGHIEGPKLEADPPDRGRGLSL